MRPLIIQISDDIFRLCKSNFVDTETIYRDGNGEYHTAETATYKLFDYLNFSFASSLSGISDKIAQEKVPGLDYLFERTILHLQYIIKRNNDWSELSMTSASFIDETHKEWNQYNPNHSIPASLVEKKINDRNEYEEQQKRRAAEEEQELRAGCAKGALIFIGIIVLILWWLISYS